MGFMLLLAMRLVDIADDCYEDWDEEDDYAGD